ncbi:retrovirus-related Pol polyprotein from transposon 17.6 [Trichonephila clavipes]|nr:retrovirus-related Pol polyprotein from transposon 17.6 [Trichonephila clavipes]
MLHHLIREEGRSWHRHIPFLLWAYREVPNATTGTPPFLLMYGRDPKGPLSILDWEHVVTSEYEGISRELFEKAKRKQKKHREFAPGDQLLVLIPDSTNKLYARWTGPVKVVKRVKPNSLYLQLAGGNLRLLHVNKIREYRTRVQTVGVVYDIDDEFGRHSPAKERIKKREIQNLQALTTKKQLRSALRLYNFYRQYIPNFAKIALLLTELTKKKVSNEIPWSKEAENAFQELKTALCGITELQVPDIEKPYYLHTDASQTVVGCCLGQLDGEDHIHAIAFGSQKLNPNQQKWSTIEREAYAII